MTVPTFMIMHGFTLVSCIFHGLQVTVVEVSPRFTGSGIPVMALYINKIIFTTPEPIN